MISAIIFIILLLASAILFTINTKKIRRNILLGRDVSIKDNKGERIKTMTLIALGQKKMFTRPIPAILHLFLYVAFVITQIELIEIVWDGAMGSHRAFRGSLGGFYTFIVSFIEILSVLAFVGTIAFLSRRNLLKVPRLVKSELNGWPKLDANFILIGELTLICFIFMMNGADEVLYRMGHSHAENLGDGSLGLSISSHLGPMLFGGMSEGSLHTGQHRRWVVTRLMQYWVSGLLMTFAGFMFLAFGLIDSEHALSFDWLTIKQNNAYLHDEVLIFVLLFFGFAIRMPLFPFHGWLPLLAEHGTVASASIFLVGLKLGVYALIRYILPMVPGVAEQWETFVLTLSLISIFYGALLALVQINIRRLLAFAVISHTGLLVIGVFNFNELGLEGSLLLSIVYGLATAGMLVSSGLIYERVRTAFIPRLGGLFDSNTAIALLFLICALSTMVMPGTPSFDAAHLLIESTIEEDGWLITIAILLGNVLAAAFLLRAFQQIFVAHPKRAKQAYHCSHHSAVKERIITLIICGLLIVSGFWSTPWLKFIDQDSAAISLMFPMHNTQSHDKPNTIDAPLNDKDSRHE